VHRILVDPYRHGPIDHTARFGFHCDGPATEEVRRLPRPASARYDGACRSGLDPTWRRSV
jgi:hypothetical protein